MYQQSQWQSGNRTSTRPEPYELLESGWIDRATEFLGYGRWAIGRPKLNGSNGDRGFRPRPPFKLPVASPTPQTQPQQAENGNGWETAIDDLLPKGELPESRRWGDNAIVHRKLLVVGAQGRGKTTFLQSHALAVRDTMNRQFFGALEDAGVSAILNDAVKEPSTVWYFAADNLTLAQLDPLDVNSWYQIRHHISRHTGLRSGLVVTAMGVHRFHGLDVNLGSEFDQLWVKSLPDRPHDRSIIQSYFDHVPAYRRKGASCPCRACEFERMGEPNNKALVRLSTGESHIVDVPYPQRNVLTDLNKPRIPNAYVALNLAIGVGLLTAVTLVFWSLARLVFRFA